MDNLQIWNKVDKTDLKYAKNTKLGGRMITAIDPQYQKLKATELFGPMGIGWGIENEEIKYMDIEETKLAHYSAQLWYKFNDQEASKIPIHANIKLSYRTRKGELFVDDNYAKKLQTDALTKGLSSLGFNADVFLGKFEDNRYIADRTLDAQANDIVTIDMIEKEIELIEADDGLKIWLMDEALMVKTGYSESNFDLYQKCINRIKSNYPEGKITKYKNKRAELVSEGPCIAARQLETLVDSDDLIGLNELWADYSQIEIKKIWRNISIEYQHNIKQMRANNG